MEFINNSSLTKIYFQMYFNEIYLCLVGFSIKCIWATNDLAEVCINLLYIIKSKACQNLYLYIF